MTAAVITVSDSCARGTREDQSGPAVSEMLRTEGFEVVAEEIVPDDQPTLMSVLVDLAKKARLVVTTGGTGLAASDVTPESTLAICERLVPGIPERMRAEGAKRTPLAALSRAVCGVRGGSLILNLPGSPRAATESLASVVHLLPHAVELLAGHTEHKPGSIKL
jgi:molybdopterin adenylyltransferase